MQMINIDTVAVPSTSTYSKIAEYPNIGAANPLICCKIAEYPNIRSANPLICSKRHLNSTNWNTFSKLYLHESTYSMYVVYRKARAKFPQCVGILKKLSHETPPAG